MLIIKKQLVNYALSIGKQWHFVRTFKNYRLSMAYKTSLQELANARKADLPGQQLNMVAQVRKQEETQNQLGHENPAKIKNSPAPELKERPNHRLYLETLDKMGPEKRLAKAFELSALSRQLFMEGLKLRFPDKSDEEIRHIYLQRVAKCYNRNY